jgi:thiamine-monophosphate kinase
MSEFEIIRRYFTRASTSAVLGVGDDAALIRSASDLVVSTDAMVEGTHFFSGADPYLLGQKSLAVNLSDIAAMGANPRWALLSLSLPHADEKWLEPFSRGFYEIATKYSVELIGGDTCRGPLNLGVTIVGEASEGKVLRRDGAAAEDDVWVSGELGDAALALAHFEGRIALDPGQFDRCARKLNSPIPRVALGKRLVGIASAAIDISDGLIADLSHVLERSQAGATIDVSQIPLSEVLQRKLPTRVALQALLAGGDDYELCFTASRSRRGQIEALSQALGLPLTRIGAIESEDGLRLVDEHGEPVEFKGRSFDHFA